MSGEYVIVNKEDIEAIANHAREANGMTDKYSVSDLAAAIGNSIVPLPMKDYQYLITTTDSNVNWTDMPFITPEMFGAVGDGETDDTAAFQALLNYSRKFVAVSNPSKTYCVSQKLTLGPYQKFDFKGATIKVIAGSKMDYVLQVNTSSYRGGSLESIKIDCNCNSYTQENAETGLQETIYTGGIYFSYSTTYTLQKVAIENFHGTGIYVKQGNITVENCLLTNWDNNDSIGMEFYGTDSKIFKVTIRNCRIGVKNCNGINYFDSIHPWLDGEFYNDNSVAFYLNGQTSLTNCYADTYNKALVVDSSQAIFVEGLKVYINPVYDKNATKQPMFLELKQSSNGHDTYVKAANSLYLYSFNIINSSAFDMVFSNCDTNDVMKVLPLKKIGANLNPFGLKNYYEGTLENLNDLFSYTRAIYREYDDSFEIDLMCTPINVADFETNKLYRLCALPHNTAEKWFAAYMGGTSVGKISFVPIRAVKTANSNALSVAFESAPQKYAIAFNQTFSKL